MLAPAVVVEARPRGVHPIAVVAGIAGIVVAVGFTLVGSAILLDLQRVAEAMKQGTGAGVTQLLLAGLVVAAITVYVGARSIRGKAGSLVLLAVLHVAFALATRSLTAAPTGRSVLQELVHRRLSVLEPLGIAAVVVAVLAAVAAIVVLATRPRSR